MTDTDRGGVPDSFSIVGSNYPRVDAFEKATGSGQYTGDIRMPDMLHGVLLRSPHAHARIASIETEDAERIPGVEAVITYRDVPRKPFNAAAHTVLGFPPAKPIEDQHVFDQKLRFVGDPVAAVAALDRRVAQKAVKAIYVNYQVLPAVFLAKEAVCSEAPLIHDASKDNLLSHVSTSSGDSERAFRTSDVVVENTYSLPRQKHCQMEPNVCVAKYDGTGNLTVWSPTQMPHLVRTMLGRLFDLPINKVRVISPLIGGAFGNRLGMVVEPYAVALTMKTNKAVRIEYDRDEDFYGSETRHPASIYIKMGGKRDGHLHSVQVHAITNTGAYATHGAPVLRVLGSKIPGPYRCQNVKYDGYCVYTNTPVSGAFRGYGGVQIMFAIESAIDELCEKLGIDPLEFRMRNIQRTGDLFKGSPIASCGLADCMIRGAERIGWKEKRRRRVYQTGSKSTGVGMACYNWVCGAQPAILDATTSVVKINEDGTVHLLIGCTDLGTGSRTTLAQIAAEELGVKFEDIQVTYGDTDVTPFDVGSHASRTCYVAGGAVQRAARDAKVQVLEEAARLLEASAADLLIRDRVIYVRGNPKANILIGEAAETAYYRGKQFIGKSSNSPQINPPSFGAQFAEVEVDRMTGEARVISFVAALDCGKAIHPEIVKGQLMGGIQQGIGFALTEEFQLDESGRPVNPNFADYKIPTSLDMPRMEVILVETVEPSGPFGAKSAGEAALVPTAPAIANAIYHATGVRMRKLPMTPERILKAIRDNAMN